MWVIYAFGSAFFAGITAILAKCGIKKTDSSLATAIRTIVVLIFAWLMVFVTHAYTSLSNVSLTTLLFLILSGLATGASWLCYFKALQLGDINKVVPIDKSSTIMTMVLAMLFLGEEVTWLKVLCIVLIGSGTYLMIERKQNEIKDTKRGWLFYAFLSAIFASLTAILGKIGITGIQSDLGTAIRTIVVLLMAWVVVFVKDKGSQMHSLDSHELLFICLSGLATGASWLCYYRALQTGFASVVVPIDKLSILFTIFFSYLVFHERLSKKALLGLLLIVTGTLLMLL